MRVRGGCEAEERAEHRRRAGPPAGHEQQQRRTRLGVAERGEQQGRAIIGCSACEFARVVCWPMCTLGSKMARSRERQAERPTGMRAALRSCRSSCKVRRAGDRYGVLQSEAVMGEAGGGTGGDGAAWRLRPCKSSCEVRGAVSQGVCCRAAPEQRCNGGEGSVENCGGADGVDPAISMCHIGGTRGEDTRNGTWW
jgi:hypothetical protein